MVIITKTEFTKKLLQNKVTIPIEIRQLLGIRDNDSIDFVIEKVANQKIDTYKVIVKKHTTTAIVMRKG